MTRTRAAVFCGILCDAIVLLGAPPLVNYSVAAARSPQTTMLQLLLLLCANLVLLGVCVCGGGIWVYAVARFGRNGGRALAAAIATRAKRPLDILR